MIDHTPTPERVTLTDEEQRTAAIVSYAAFWWSQETGETDEWDDLDANEREAVTENSYAETAVDWFAAREQALREEIAGEVEAADFPEYGMYARTSGHRLGLTHAARIARGAR